MIPPFDLKFVVIDVIELVLLLLFALSFVMVVCIEGGANEIET
ncbi:hypothetical protein [uncultured Gammaproteobacteria bacterium]|uniref:Uncharacterized protein n=1 Tax=Bathymodiolus azoricus thioautotrophic gill symbiont TaxID=235205 RepID=A0A1H6K5R5_9GAMM|nr:hypothetical protein [uncultured Gammaproteobacteria bacterium]CAC9489694.1 hypothetical protein [uncultured Gammaproteobacteria bacterium]SEH67121.1 hypothetical protein BAZSYMA_ACONTIG03627_4 [Bathymodiolus azoricus thioautotrophic gill symbiont]